MMVEGHYYVTASDDKTQYDIMFQRSHRFVFQDPELVTSAPKEVAESLVDMFTHLIAVSEER